MGWGLISAQVHGAENHEYTDDNGIKWIYYVTAEKTAVIRGCDRIPDDGVMVIPGQVDEYPVSSINRSAFSQIQELKEIVLPEGIRSIGESSFQSCTNLKKMNFPASLTTLCQESFNNCGFEELVIPASLTDIEEGAFAMNMNLKKVTIQDSRSFARATPAQVFKNSRYLEEYCVSNQDEAYSVTDGIVYSKDGETLIAYPAGREPRSFVVPSNVKVLGSKCVAYNWLKQVILPEGLEEMSDSFQASIYLTSIVIPKGIKEIPEGCFSDCYALRAVELNDGLESIGVNAFFMCNQMVRIYIPDSVDHISDTAFEHHGDLTFCTTNDMAKEYAEEHQIRLEEMTRAEFEKIMMEDPNIPENPKNPTVPANPDNPTVPAEPDNPSSGEDVQTLQSQKVTGTGKYTKYIGQSFTLNAKAKTALSYRSSNTSIATVNSKGKVTIKGYGTCKITVKAKETAAYKAATKKITVMGRLAKPVVKAENRSPKRVKLTWSKVQGTTGYKVYIRYPGRTKYKLALTKSAKVKSVTHRNLTKGETYSYKVRAYKKVGKKIVYSSYSKAKKVRIRK